jgi:ribonuclease HI
MDTLTIYTHGAAKGNPGPAVIGVYVIDQKGQVRMESAEAIGNANADYAKYFAVVRALQMVSDEYKGKTNLMNIELTVDNELVLGHLTAKTQIKDVGLIGHFIEIYNLRVSNFPELHIKQISGEQNINAIALAQSLLDA